MRNAEKIISMLKDETKFNYSFMEKEIDNNPEYFYSILFDNSGAYDEQYKFKTWTIEKLSRSIFRNYNSNDCIYGYKKSNNTEERKDIYFKNITQLLTQKLNTGVYNKKLIDLFNDIYSYMGSYFEINTLPIIALLEQGYALCNSCLYDFYEYENKKDIQLLVLMLKNSVFECDIFKTYIHTLSKYDIHQLINIGYEINSNVLEWYIQTNSESYTWSFNFDTFNFLVENSVLENKVAPYEKLFIKLIYTEDLKLLKQFDFSKISINEVLNKNEFSPENEKLNRFIMTKFDCETFGFLIDNEYKLKNSFFRNFLNTNNSQESIRFYISQLEQSNMIEKNIYYKQVVKITFSQRLHNALMYEVLNQLEIVEIFEYGIELLLEQNDIVYLLNKLENGYIPSINIIRKILKIQSVDYILDIIEKRYPEVYNTMLPHLF